MANDSTSFFYWYRRYKVRAQDMNAFQGAMAETARGIGEGMLGASILKGFAVNPASGLVLAVDPGIALAASGYLEVMNSGVTLDVAAAVDPSLPTRSLVVVTPDPTDANYINSPTDPFTMVPLNQLQKSRVVLLAGTPSATPDYPAKGPNDVILCGIRAPAGVATITTSMLDFEARESIGVNSLIAQNQVRFDNRLRPYRLSPKVLGVKPSQNIGSAPQCFSYPGRLTPSLYPLTAGNFTPSDSFVNFETGVISGGDASTPTLSPVIPPSNKSVVCVVTLTQADHLNFNFGDLTGTYDQCLASIKNQVFSGPGSLPAPDGNFGIAYVILTSIGGVLSDTQVFDGRPFLGSGAAAAKFKNEVPTGVVNGSNNVFTLSTTPADPKSLSFLIDSGRLEDTDFTLNDKIVTITNPSFIPAPGQSVYASYLIYGAVSNNPSSGIPLAQFKQEVPLGSVDGSNGVFTLSSVPVDNASIDFWVDSNHLELTDFTVLGNTITITNPDFIPAIGQSVYAKYLYLGVLMGGGGGGGTSGYAPLGSKASPIVVNAASGIASTTDPLQTWFIRSPTGIQVVSKNPQISAGIAVGQVMKLKAVQSANFPVFQDGNGLSLNGMWPATGGVVDESAIELTWDGTVWSEDSRR